MSRTVSVAPRQPDPVASDSYLPICGDGQLTKGWAVRPGPQTIGTVHPVVNEPKFSFSYLSHEFESALWGVA